MTPTVRTALIGIGSFCVLACGIGGYAALGCFRDVQRGWSEAQTFADGALARVGKGWSVAEMQALAQGPATESQLDQARALTKMWREKYGDYVSGKGKIVSFNSQSTTSGSWSDFRYAGEVVCSKRSAHVEMLVRSQGDRWYLLRLNVTD